jgi:uncharacterized protein (DUF1501 family)
MFAMGGGIKGGRIHAGPWPGLSDENLEGPGDVPVLNNYRNILAPVLLRHGLAESALPQVFPDFELKPVAMYA